MRRNVARSRSSRCARRVVGAAVLGLVMSVLTTIAPLSAPVASGVECTVSAKLVNSCRAWLGAESGGYISGGFKAMMLEHENRAGRRLDIVHEYLGVNAVLTSDVVATLSDAQRRLFGFHPTEWRYDVATEAQTRYVRS